MNSRIRDYGRSLILGVLAGIMLAIVFAAGFLARDLIDDPLFAQASDNTYPLLDEVERYLENHYLRELPDTTTREYAAVRGMLGTLDDRNTFFIDPPVAASESDALAGTYGGIGVQLQRSTEGDYILFPFEDSPAKAAGILDGDILVAVNGQIIDASFQQDAVDQMLRGEVKDDNGVEITVLQANGKELTVFIKFDVINVPSVIWRVLPENERIGYVRILRFTNRTPDETKQALSELREAGIESLVLDLRNNGGGLLLESVEVAGEFLGGGVILYEKTNTEEKTFTAEENGLMTDLPLVVLINGGTASAAELVAGAIADHERGILIGQRSYGKGTIQQIFELSDKSSIHITSAEWFTPDRKALDGVGLEPMITTTPDPEGRDVELTEAIIYLENILTTEENPS